MAGEKFTVIEGGKALPDKAPDGSKWEKWECPFCLHYDGLTSVEVAITYPRARTDGRRISLKGQNRNLLICIRCTKKGRELLYGKVGAIADYERGVGWVRFIDIENGKTVLK